jgi:arylsulfatase A-like enzyme
MSSVELPAGRFNGSVSAARDFAAALALSIGFMLVTGIQSAATLAYRANSTDTMRAATREAWSGRIGQEIAYFVFAQLVLHVTLALVVWLLVRATVVVQPALRARSGRIVLGWFCALALAILTYNAFWFPRTGIGAYYHHAAARMIGPFPVGPAIYWSIVAAALIVLGAASVNLARRMKAVRRNSVLLATASVVIASLVAILAADGSRAGDRVTGAKPATPHVIVLGIDSLRLEYLRRFGGAGLTPNLDRFLSNADLVRDTTTPAARTFSSWVAILTGRSPTVTGARFNLADRTTVSANPTIGDVLGGRGYHTVYSTDDVRFANIDETFGFDQVITPPIGASDFLLGTFNELPLASVVINSRIGQVLFPFSYANRAAATVFQPETYIARLHRELRFDRPTLLMAHLTASHYPYYVSDVPLGAAEQKRPDDRPLYRLGVETVDRMFGDVVALLAEKGALDEAIVVVLSDHGEALGLPGDAMFEENSRIEGLRAPIKMVDFGHGQSVLSPVQYQVLFGVRSFGAKPAFSTAGRDIQGGATVEDISPTLLDLLGVTGDPLSANGRSVAAVLRDPARSMPVAAPDRIRFTETDLKVLPNPDASVNEMATARNNSMFFAINPETGRLSMRARYVPLAMAFKERAAFDETLLLAAIPAGPDAHQYLLVNRKTREARLLLERPGADAPDAQRVWDAMWAHYSGELKPPMSVTPADWPAIDDAWRNFFTNSERGIKPPSSAPAS